MLGTERATDRGAHLERACTRGVPAPLALERRRDGRDRRARRAGVPAGAALPGHLRAGAGDPGPGLGTVLGGAGRRYGSRRRGVVVIVDGLEHVGVRPLAVAAV